MCRDKVVWVVVKRLWARSDSVALVSGLPSSPKKPQRGVLFVSHPMPRPASKKRKGGE